VTLRRLLLVTAVALGLTAVGPTLEHGWDTPTAEAKPKTSSKKSSKPSSKQSSRKRGKKVAKVKLCTESGKKKKRRCSFVQEFQGHGVASASLRKEPLDRPSGDIWLSAENLREEVRLNIYKPDGSYDDAALAQLDEMFRCKRTGEVRSVDPRLYEQLSRIYDHFGGKRVNLVSGFRFAERSSSRHFHASAMDIRIDGVTIREMYAFAESLDGGGMGIGIYPRSGFIHVDFRAPGDPSYRWTDYSGPNSGKARKKSPGRTARAKKPTS